MVTHVACVTMARAKVNSNCSKSLAVSMRGVFTLFCIRRRLGTYKVQNTSSRASSISCEIEVGLSWTR
jgi:hypothetical protein